MKQLTHLIQPGYLSLVPFLIALAWPLLMGSDMMNQQVFIAYSTGLLGFWAGSLWRSEQQSERRATLSLLILFIAPCSVFVTPTLGLGFLAFAYWLVLLIEFLGKDLDSAHRDYRKMRFLTTSVTFVSHLLVLAMSLDRPA